jgi:hypothetical protein
VSLACNKRNTSFKDSKQIVIKCCFNQRCGIVFEDSITRLHYSQLSSGTLWRNKRTTRQKVLLDSGHLVINLAARRDGSIQVVAHQFLGAIPAEAPAAGQYRRTHRRAEHQSGCGARTPEKRERNERNATRRESRAVAGGQAQETHARVHASAIFVQSSHPLTHMTRGNRGSLMMKKQVSASGRTLSPSWRSSRRLDEDGKTFMSRSVV